MKIDVEDHDEAFCGLEASRDEHLWYSSLRRPYPSSSSFGIRASHFLPTSRGCSRYFFFHEAHRQPTDTSNTEMSLSSCDIQRYHFAEPQLDMFEGVRQADWIDGDHFFEVTDPPYLAYTYKMRIARDFGGQFVSSFA